jgi:anti-sigma factor RsiW
MNSPENPSPTDPRLTAYLLDELEPAERAAFEAELAGVRSGAKPSSRCAA